MSFVVGLSSHVTSRAVAPLSEIERNDLLDALLSEPRLLAAAFAPPNRPPVVQRHILAALSARKRLTLVEARLILAGRNLVAAEKCLAPVR